ncbi:MAG: uncharacterized membrane protein (UPF0127 family) [Myxococcota bacterium]
MIISLIFLCAFSPIDRKNYSKNLQIKNPKTNQIHHFKIAVSADPISREKGLMFVENLPENYGMMFEFKQKRIIYMWMKNTKIPLDMLFINENGKIINIEKQAQPESLKKISSIKTIKKVLEINGGLSDKLGIEVGYLVVY